MKKIVILFAVVLITTTSFAQRQYDNEFYFRFGYSNPSWKQFGMMESDWGDGFEKWGVMFELGTIFMLNSISNYNNIRFGINVDYLTIYGHHFYNTRFFDDAETIRFDLGTVRVGSKIGPSVTFSPKEKVAFDIYVKADIAWATETILMYDEDIDDADWYEKIGAVGVSTGVNARFGILMLGFEFNTISPKLEYEDVKGEYLGNFNDSDSDKSPLPSMNFSVGLSF